MNRRLARDFLRWVSDGTLPGKNGGQIQVSQQNIPGEVIGLKEGERRSLPDACLFVPEEWCLVIESKVTAALTADQLRRHRQMVLPLFKRVEVLAITADPTPKVPVGVQHRTWVSVFEWLAQRSGTDEFWRHHLREFMRLLESQYLEREVHLPGALTTFDGIPFGPSHPYSYTEAKLLLKQAMELLRKRPSLRNLGRNPVLTGRPAISGSKERVVWDLLSLAPAGEASKFTQWPHLTLGIHQDKVEVMVTIPNDARTRVRNVMLALGKDSFLKLLTSLSDGMIKAVGKNAEAIPTLLLLQRHYVAQKKAIEDGRLRIDLRTVSSKQKGAVKPQPAWAIAAFELFVSRSGNNMQLQIGTEFPHSGAWLQGGEALDRIEKSWLTLRPLLHELGVCPP